MHWPILSTSCYVPVRFYTVRSQSGSKRFDSERASIAVLDSILCLPVTADGPAQGSRLESNFGPMTFCPMHCFPPFAQVCFVLLNKCLFPLVGFDLALFRAQPALSTSVCRSPVESSATQRFLHAISN